MESPGMLCPWAAQIDGTLQKSLGFQSVPV